MFGYFLFWSASEHFEAFCLLEGLKQGRPEKEKFSSVLSGSLFIDALFK